MALLAHDDRLRVEVTTAAAAPAASGLESHHDGPAEDAYRTLQPVVSTASDAPNGWPDFNESALAHGFQSSYAMPMRAGSECMGTIMLLSHDPNGEATTADTAQALVDTTTWLLVSQRRLDEALTVTDQLQTALVSRVTLEQAKGILSERLGITPDGSFQSLRQYCRSNNLNIRRVATEIVDERSEPHVNGVERSSLASRDAS